jgi:hypothetical protein
MHRWRVLPVKPCILLGVVFLTPRILSQPQSPKQASRSALGRTSRRWWRVASWGLLSLNQLPAVHEIRARKWAAAPHTASIHRDAGPEYSRILCCDRPFIVLPRVEHRGKTTLGLCRAAKATSTYDF